MKGLSRIALAMLLVAACGRDSAITEPDAPNTPARPLLPSTPNGRVVLAIGVDPTTGASIETNKDDYTPGEAVNVVGRGWTAGETVHLSMTEDPDTHADVTMDVQADSAGGFEVVFYGVTPADLGVTFTLTATGVTSGSVAVATFTDGSVTFSSTAPVTNVISRALALGTTCPTSGFVLATSITLNAGNVPSCVEVRAPTTVLVGATTYTFSSWSATLTQAPTPIAAPTTGVTGSTQWLRFLPTEPSASGSIVANYSAPPSNTPPTAEANGDYFGNTNTAIALSGVGSTDTDGTITTYAWTYSVTSSPDGGTCTFTNASSNSPTGATISCTQDGTYEVKLTVTDDDGATDDDVATLTIYNQPPTADAGGPYSSVPEGSPLALDGSGSSDSDGSIPVNGYTWTYQVVTADPGASCNITNANTVSASITCTDDGTFSVKLVVTDDDGATGEETVNITVTNAKPTANADANATGGYTGDEGADVQLTGSQSDAGSNDTHTYSWAAVPLSGVDLGASCSFTNGTTLTPKVKCTDDGVWTLTLTVTDDDGDFGTSDATLTLSNVAPTVTITSPTVGQLFNLLNGAIPVTATYTDPGSNDTHTCQLTLDGDPDVVGLPFAPSVAGTCSGSILPTHADVFNLIVTVTDDDGGVGTASVMIVVYDPSAGFVTGGGWINSAAGAYKLGTNLAGKATFGFVSKYLKGATIPTGNTEFQFHAAGMNFNSTSYQFLIVNQNGTNAQFQGKGTINGTGQYTFVLWATDGGNSNDTFRLQITDDNNSGALVYDNLTDQVISGGSIIVHAPKK